VYICGICLSSLLKFYLSLWAKRSFFKNRNLTVAKSAIAYKVGVRFAVLPHSLWLAVERETQKDVVDHYLSSSSVSFTPIMYMQ